MALDRSIDDSQIGTGLPLTHRQQYWYRFCHNHKEGLSLLLCILAIPTLVAWGSCRGLMWAFHKAQRAFSKYFDHDDDVGVTHNYKGPCFLCHYRLLCSQSRLMSADASEVMTREWIQNDHDQATTWFNNPMMWIPIWGSFV
jgi:hypothetical protein